MITARESATIGAWKSYFPLFKETTTDRPTIKPIQPTNRPTN